MTKSIALLAVIACFACGAFAQTNVAPAHGTASQSSTSYGGAAALGIDNNTNGIYYAGSVTHTNSEQGWWQVQLDALYAVSQINVFNRTDCCADRINGFEVLLFNGTSQVWSSGNVPLFIPDIAGTNVSGMSFSLGQSRFIGDRVRVEKTSVNYLQLAEVQVMATAVPEPELYALMIAGLTLIGLAVWRRKESPVG